MQNQNKARYDSQVRNLHLNLQDGSHVLPSVQHEGCVGLVAISKLYVPG